MFEQNIKEIMRPQKDFYCYRTDNLINKENRSRFPFLSKPPVFSLPFD